MVQTLKETFVVVSALTLSPDFLYLTDPSPTGNLTNAIAATCMISFSFAEYHTVQLIATTKKCLDLLQMIPEQTF